jgi:hypothetical protein
MLAMVSVDAGRAIQGVAIDVVAALLDEHEAVLVVDGVDTVDGCQHLAATLRARRPRSVFIVLLADPGVCPDRDLIAEILQCGQTPVIAVPDGAATVMAALLADRLPADAMLRLSTGYDNSLILDAYV